MKTESDLVSVDFFKAPLSFSLIVLLEEIPALL